MNNISKWVFKRKSTHMSCCVNIWITLHPNYLWWKCIRYRELHYMVFENTHTHTHTHTEINIYLFRTIVCAGQIVRHFCKLSLLKLILIPILFLNLIWWLYVCLDFDTSAILVQVRQHHVKLRVWLLCIILTSMRNIDLCQIWQIAR